MKLTRDIGIDLGTANVLVYEEGRGIVLREPSVVAVDKNTGKVLQVGAAARNMLGRTPGNVVAVRPLRDGVISDYEMTEKMLEQFLKKISKFSLFGFFLLLYQILGDLQWGFRGICPYKFCVGVKQKGSVSIRKRSLL